MRLLQGVGERLFSYTVSGILKVFCESKIVLLNVLRVLVSTHSKNYIVCYILILLVCVCVYCVKSKQYLILQRCTPTFFYSILLFFCSIQLYFIKNLLAIGISGVQPVLWNMLFKRSW